MVIDNEAGLEHLSRRTTHDTDLLLVMSDPSRRGIQAAKRDQDLAGELKLNIGRTALILNRVDGSPDPALMRYIEDQGMSVTGMVPADPVISEFDAKGKPVMDLPDDSPAVVAVEQILDELRIP